MRSTLLRILPKDSWDPNDNLVPPEKIEMAVVKALATTHDSVTTYTTKTKCGNHNVDDHILTVIISGMISIRLGYMRVEVPDMPGEISDILCSICKEMMDYNQNTVKKLIDHYITHGTDGLENSDVHYKFFLLFMDIKSVVYNWITTVNALPPKKRMKKLDQ